MAAAEAVNLIDPLKAEKAARKGDGRLACKFVVIEHQDILRLVFGLISDFPYHASLIDRYCEAGQIPAGWVKKPDLVEVYDEEVRIRGGGYLVVDPQKSTALFSGYSTAYGCYEPADVRLIVESDDFFAGYSVKIPD